MRCRAGASLDFLLTPLNASTPWAKGVELVLLSRFAWLQAGSVNVTASSITLSAAGMAPITLHTTTPGTVADGALKVTLGNGPIGLSTTAGRSVASIQSLLKAAAAKEEALLAEVYGPYWLHAMAVKGAAMWNLIFNPSENGAALLPVSRHTVTIAHSEHRGGEHFHEGSLCVFAGIAGLEFRTDACERRLDLRGIRVTRARNSLWVLHFWLIAFGL